jgi:hypothetical protein
MAAWLMGVGFERILDIFPYGNVLFPYGKSSYNV